MAISLYDASIPGYINMLRNLSGFLDKAEAHAATGGERVEALVDASFGHEMLPFKAQVQLASDAAKSGAAYLSGIEAPAMPDTESTFAELKAGLSPHFVSHFDQVFKLALEYDGPVVVVGKAPAADVAAAAFTAP